MSDFTTDRAARVEELRGALLAAAAVDLSGGEPADTAAVVPRAGRGARRLRFEAGRARAALALLVVALALPGVAIGTGMLGAGEAVADGLPAGSTVMTAMQPTCTALREGVEYRCVFAAPQRQEGVVHTVDSSGQVDGGCRSLDEVKTVWICYFGAAAVHQQVVSQVAL
jgi:hypothetical protein